MKKEIIAKYRIKFAGIDTNKKPLYTSDIMPTGKWYIEDIEKKIYENTLIQSNAIQKKEDFISFVESHGYTINKLRRLYQDDDYAFDNLSIEEFFQSLIIS